MTHFEVSIKCNTVNWDILVNGFCGFCKKQCALILVCIILIVCRTGLTFAEQFIFVHLHDSYLFFKCSINCE